MIQICPCTWKLMTLIGRTPIHADIITFNGPSPRILTLRIGEIVQALALTSTRQGNVALQIGDSVLKANTYIPIEKGQRLSLEVIKVSDQITLKLQQGQIESDLFISTIRKAMPYQRGMSSLLANLTHITDKGHPLLPPRLRQAVEKIIGQLPHFSNLTGSLALKKAIMASGIFLEARLAQQSGAMQSQDLAGDFKASLLVLYNLVSRIVGKERGRHNNKFPVRETTTSQFSQLKPPLRWSSPKAQASSIATIQDLSGKAVFKELQGQIESVLARIQLNQLASLDREGDCRHIWHLELPVRNADRPDIFHLRIEKEAPGTKDSGVENWTVSLAFDLEGFGPVHARVTVTGLHVSATFWSARETTADLFREHFSNLADNLEQAGLSVGSLICHIGAPTCAGRTPDSQIFLHEKA